MQSSSRQVLCTGKVHDTRALSEVTVRCCRPGERRQSVDRDGSDSEDSFTGSFSGSMNGSGVSGGHRVAASDWTNLLATRCSSRPLGSLGAVHGVPSSEHSCTQPRVQCTMDERLFASNGGTEFARSAAFETVSCAGSRATPTDTHVVCPPQAATGGRTAAGAAAATTACPA